MKYFTQLIAPVLFFAVILTGFAPEGPETKKAAPSTWTIDKGHSQVGFKVRHLGITNVNGSFQQYDAMLRFDPDDLSTLEVDATIDASSIDTGIERRDNHLRGDDFFSAEQFPSIRFVSKAVRNLDGDTFELVGDLTIRDITREVVLDVEFLGTNVVRGTRKAGFEAETSINRFDYDLKWDRLTEAGGLVVAEKVRIILELEVDEESSAG